MDLCRSIKKMKYEKENVLNEKEKDELDALTMSLYLNLSISGLMLQTYFMVSMILQMSFQIH